MNKNSDTLFIGQFVVVQLQNKYLAIMDLWAIHARELAIVLLPQQVASSPHLQNLVRIISLMISTFHSLVRCVSGIEVFTVRCVYVLITYRAWYVSTEQTFLNLLTPSGNFTYHQVQHSEILHSAQVAFMYFVHISEQTAAFTVNVRNSFVFYNRG
jgi:hypothetical protein